MSNLSHWLEHHNKKLTDSEINLLLAAFVADKAEALKSDAQQLKPKMPRVEDIIKDMEV